MQKQESFTEEQTKHFNTIQIKVKLYVIELPLDLGQMTLIFASKTDPDLPKFAALA